MPIPKLHICISKRVIIKIPSKKLMYFGESLGSGVAVQMATERPPGL
jgi:hypothetical protein